MRDQNLDTNPMFSEDSILPEQFRAPPAARARKKSCGAPCLSKRWPTCTAARAGTEPGPSGGRGCGPRPEPGLLTGTERASALSPGSARMLGLDAALLRTALLIEPAGRVTRRESYTRQETQAMSEKEFEERLIALPPPPRRFSENWQENSRFPPPKKSPTTLSIRP